MKIMRMINISPFCPDAKANYARVACERSREGQMFQLNLQPIAADCNQTKCNSCNDWFINRVETSTPGVRVSNLQPVLWKKNHGLLNYFVESDNSLCKKFETFLNILTIPEPCSWIGRDGKVAFWSAKVNKMDSNPTLVISMFQ